MAASTSRLQIRHEFFRLAERLAVFLLLFGLGGQGDPEIAEHLDGGVLLILPPTQLVAHFRQLLPVPGQRRLGLFQGRLQRGQFAGQILGLLVMFSQL